MEIHQIANVDKQSRGLSEFFCIDITTNLAGKCATNVTLFKAIYLGWMHMSNNKTMLLLVSLVLGST